MKNYSSFTAKFLRVVKKWMSNSDLEAKTNIKNDHTHQLRDSKKIL